MASLEWNRGSKALRIQSLGWEDPLEKGKATHSSVLAWRIPMNRGAWWAAVYGVAQSWTRLKRLSSSSIHFCKGHCLKYSGSAGDLRELARVPLRGEGSCGGGGAPRDSAGSGA